MSKGQRLRALLNERLTAAAEDIFALFERTIAEYEEELCRSKEKNERKQQLLDSVLSPRVLVHRADVQIQSQEGNSSSHTAVNTEMPQFKEEQNEWIIKQEKEHHSFNTMTVVTENKEILLHFTSLPQQNEANSEATKEDCEGGNGLDAEHLQTNQEAQTDHSPDRDNDWTQSVEFPDEEMEPEANGDNGDTVQAMDTPRDINQQNSNSFFTSKTSSTNANKRRSKRSRPAEFVCSYCGKTWLQECDLQRHVKKHLRLKPFSCSMCEMTFSHKDSLKMHMGLHTGQRAFTCRICNKGFNRKYDMGLHIAIQHLSDKTLCCPVCKQSYTRVGKLKIHMTNRHKKELYHISS